MIRNYNIRVSKARICNIRAFKVNLKLADSKLRNPNINLENPEIKSLILNLANSDIVNP